MELSSVFSYVYSIMRVSSMKNKLLTRDLSTEGFCPCGYRQKNYRQKVHDNTNGYYIGKIINSGSGLLNKLYINQREKKLMY